jgi:cysteine desulfurase/selenocysteine lyase
LKLLLDVGLDNIEGRILTLTQLLVEGLQDIDGLTLRTPQEPQQRAGIVTVELPPGVDAKQVFKSLLERKVMVALREGKLRYAPHFYNTSEELTLAIERTREALAH